MMERGSWVGVVGVLASALVIGWTAAENWHDARDVLDAGVSYGLLLVLVASAVLAAAAAVRAVSLLRDPARRARPATARGRARAAGAVIALGLALLFVVVFQQVLGITQDPSWPPPPDAVTAADAEAATEAFVARDGVRPHDAALDFARSTAATIEPWVEGANFFPRIFADVEAARSSVHILMFGWREGDVGTRMAALLERKLREGVEVRVIVDRFGSRPYDEAQEMFEGSQPRERRSWSTTSSPSTGTVSIPTTVASTGVRTRWGAPTIASCTSSTERSRGPAVRGSRTTSRTAASTT